MRPKLCALIVSASALFSGAIGQPTSAGTIPGITSLQDLISRGPQQANGIQIGNEVFYNFALSSSPVPGTGGAPTASNVGVTSTDSGTGLRFSYGWNSTNGANVASNITYSVHVVNTVPQQSVAGALLDFQSSVNTPVPSAFLDTGTTTETLSDAATNNAFAQLTVSNTGTSPASPITNTMALSPSRDFSVMDGIVVHSGVGTGGTASVTYVENIFNESSAVPEPAMVGMLILAGLPLLSRRRV